MRPSRSLSRRRTASVTLGLRKNAVMNLALPSGSSPPEKPPGIMMIWLLSIFSTKAFVLSATASGVRLLMMKVSGTAPARSKASAVSYSQLLPGKTGMMTRGLARLPQYVSGILLASLIMSTPPPSSRYGNTSSSSCSHASCSTARRTVSSPAMIAYSSMVSPSSTTCMFSVDSGSSAPGAISTAKDPYALTNSVSRSTSSLMRRPIPLPRHILKSSSASPPKPGVPTAST